MGSEGLGVPEGPLVTSSLPQGGCATFLCQPLDVLKTRLMNSKGEYQVKTGTGSRAGRSSCLLPPFSGARTLSAAALMGAQGQGCCPLFPSRCSALGSTCIRVGLYFPRGLGFSFRFLHQLTGKLFTRSVESGLCVAGALRAI